MKIEISEESYQFLKDLATEIKNQNNRCTASPYFYSIYEDRSKYELDTIDPTDYDEEDIDDDEELVIIMDGIDKFETVQAVKDHCGYPSSMTLEELCKKQCLEVWREEIKREPAYKYNCFLTEKACQEHIDSNDYHYRKPVSYVQHAWRNPEMTKLLEIIKEIAENERQI